MAAVKAEEPVKCPGNKMSWKRKAWGTKMQHNGLDNTPVTLKGLAGRPGSPASEALDSMISSPSSSECYGPMKSRPSRSQVSIPANHTSSRTLDCSPYPRVHFDPAQGTEVLEIPLSNLNMKLNEEGQLVFRDGNDYESIPSSAVFHQMIMMAGNRRRCVSEGLPRPIHDVGSIPARLTRRSASSGSGTGIAQRIRLTNPEVELIDDLDRKLEWLSSEMDPGRKAFHFPSLYNHWLNKETWVVGDPVCRVNSEKRRLYGDPRFNYPWPGPEPPPKQKYPTPIRTKAETPRIDSWRLAVSKARKSSGIRNFPNAVELFEGSADEPPDGAVDPATWVLKRPPQGFEMSTKQKTAYYEGGGGWYEKLPDWQNVGRTYRLRKVVCEGKAHRRRAIELARSVSGGCKAAARRVSAAWASKGRRTQNDPEKQRTQELSRHDSISHRPLAETCTNPSRPSSPAPMISVADAPADQPGRSTGSSSTDESNPPAQDRMTIVTTDAKPFPSIDLVALCPGFSVTARSEVALHKYEESVDQASEVTAGAWC